MEIFGLIAFVLSIFNIGLKNRVTKLKKDITRIKKTLKGNNLMAKMLKELEGKHCKITLSESMSGTLECDVISVENEWMKLSQIVKKKQSVVKIIRVDDISAIEIIADD